MRSRWSRSTRLVAAGLVATIAAAGLAACGDDAEPAVSFERRGTTFERQEDDDTAAPEDQTQGLDLDEVPVEDQDDVIIEAAISDVEDFWTDEFPSAVGGTFEPVGGGFFPYGPQRTLPTCGQRLTYEEIAQNAFYCPIDDLIAWDTDNLTNTLLEQFGPFTLAIVMAHEYGHAVQARGALNPNLATIAGEQQADCFAGAFTAYVNDGESDNFAIAIDDLDLAVAGFLQLRDQPGTSTADPSAHGSGFDRIGAFQDGFLNGAARCVEYSDIFERGESTAVDVPLTEDATGQVQFDAPFDPADPESIFLLTLGSLETFWADEMEAQFDEEWSALFQDDRVTSFSVDDPGSLPDCEGEDIDEEDAAGQAFACFGDEDDPDDDFIAFDIDEAARLYDEVGDFAVSGFLSQQYAFLAQELLGFLDGSKDAFLQADCFSGAWTGALTLATLNEGGQALLSPDFDQDGEPTNVSISAGDLDEAIQSFLLVSGGNSDEQGSPFERVTAFRDGFFNGLASCATYLEDGAPSVGELQGIEGDEG
jgi:predicted metalloprotease